MQIKIINRSVKIRGRMYNPGAITDVSNQTARVLRATHRAGYHVPHAATPKLKARPKMAAAPPQAPAPDPAVAPGKVSPSVDVVTTEGTELSVTQQGEPVGAMGTQDAPVSGSAKKNYNRRDITP